MKMLLWTVLLMQIYALGNCSATKFIVQLTDETSLHQFLDENIYQDSGKQNDLEIYTIGDLFKGFSASFDMDTMEKLYSHSQVAAISIDRKAALQEYILQNNPPPHLSRLSNVGDMEASYPFIFHSTAGNGVDIYVIDSGIDMRHPGFGTKQIHKLLDLAENPLPSGDPTGHGTAVAGIIGSETFGVAKKCNLVDVRVVDKSSKEVTLSKLLKALQISEAHSKITMRPSVIVLPLSMDKNPIFNSALQSLNPKLAIIAAAGNQNTDACQYSPASTNKLSNMLVVGSLDYNSTSGVTPSNFTNYGSCVDVYTSGTNIDTLNAMTSHKDNQMITQMSGTSASCAIVAGTIGYYMSLGLNSTEAIHKLKTSSIARSHKQNPKEKFNIVNLIP